MVRSSRKFVGIMALAIMLTTTTYVNPSLCGGKNIAFAEVKKSELKTNTRVSGEDRYRTAIAVSKIGWEKADYVIIATGENFADALCSVPLSKIVDAPILLTESLKLNNEVKEEIIRLKAKKVYVIGGKGAVAEEVEKSIMSISGIDIERISGIDRYSTSVAIAKKHSEIAKEKGVKLSDKVAVVDGTNFADAISIASAAANIGMPILLTEKMELSKATENYLLSMNFKGAYVVGGESVIENSVKNRISSIIKFEAKRLSGTDRYETNAVVLKEFEKELKFNSVYMATGGGSTGSQFADALAGAALAAKNNAPLILVDKEVCKSTMDFIKTKVKDMENIVTIGGAGAVSEETSKKLGTAIEEAKAEEKKKEENKPQIPSGGGSSSGGGGGTTPVDPPKPEEVNKATYGTNPKIQVVGPDITFIYKAEENDLGITVFGYKAGSDIVKFTAAGTVSQFVNGSFEDKTSGLEKGKYKVVIKVSTRDSVKEQVMEIEIK